MAGVRNGIVYSEEYMSYKYHFEWDIYGQDEQGRKIVRWKLVSDSSGSYSRMTMHLVAYDVNGESLKVEGLSPWKSSFVSGEIIDSGDFICPLDTHQITIEGSCYINAGIGLAIAGVWELTTEYTPSPSTIACSTAAIGQAPTIAITKKDVDTYVTITYTFGTLTGTVVEGYSGEVYTGWIIPDTFYNEMTDVNNKKGTMVATSYREGVMTGTESCSFTVKVDVDECAPTINVTVADTNATTTAITKDNTFFIKGYSNATVTVDATANMGATIASYYINNNGRVATTQNATFNGITSGSFVITVTDSRGVSATTTVNISLIDYTRVTCVVSATPPTTEGKTTITVSGRYFAHALGYTGNTLAVKYRKWRHGDGANEDWYDVEFTQENGVYEAELPFSDLDYKSAYTFEAVATDLLSSETSSISVKTTPVFSWSNDDFEFNVPVNIIGELETDDLVVTNSTDISGTTNIDGTVEIGGTITLKPPYDGAVTIDGDLSVDAVNTTGDVTIDGKLSTTGSATVGTDLTVTDKVTAARLEVTGDADFGANMRFSGGIDVRGEATFDKPATFDDTTTFNDTATFTNITVTGSLTYPEPFVDYVITSQGKSLYPSTTGSPYVQWGWRYRIWKSGYAECWGQMNESWRHLSSEEETVDVPFPITFSNTSYFLIAMPRIGEVAGSVTQGAMTSYEMGGSGFNPRSTTGTKLLVKHLDYSSDGDAYYNLNVYVCGSVST